MSFFDDKQEVLKIELTPYGKNLLANGKLKPVFYSFFFLFIKNSELIFI